MLRSRSMTVTSEPRTVALAIELFTSNRSGVLTTCTGAEKTDVFPAASVAVATIYDSDSPAMAGMVIVLSLGARPAE